MKEINNSKILLGKLHTEYITVSRMVVLFCAKHHKPTEKIDGVCKECRELADYAELKLDRCPYGEDKPACNRCPIHCYKPEQKEQMRAVMRYAGPRMLLQHPILAIRHLLHEKRKVPELTKAMTPNRNKRKKA